MNVITLASCKTGTGKTTLAAQLAGHAIAQGRRCLVVDADPRGAFALLNSRRAEGALPLASAERGLERPLEVADFLGYDWALIDTAPAISLLVQEAIRVATIELVRSGRRPYAVVLNAAPLKCEDKEAQAVADTRAALDRYAIPVWSGQISERTGYAVATGEAEARALATAEIARLWSMIERSVEAVNAAKAGVAQAKAA
jgi:chromosome partitioning protein